MKLNKHCHCKINPCKCSSNTKTITPIILKKNRDKIDSCKNNISEPELLPVKDKCPTNKISSISRLGNEIIVVMDDCTYYSTDINSIDLDSFQRNNNPSEEEKDIYVKDIYLSGSELKLIRTDEVELKADLSTIDFSTFITGLGLTVISVKAKENGNTLEVTYRDINTGEITKEDVIIEGDTQDIENIINNLNNKIDASKIKSTELSNGTYTITLEDNTKFDTDFSGLITADKFVNSGAVISGNKLQLNFNDGSSVEIDLSELKIDIPTSDSEIISGKTEGHEIILERVKDNIIIDATSLILKSVEETLKILNNLSYDIKRKAENYTVTSEDMTGKVMILATGTEPTQKITLGRLSKEFIGRAVNITHRMAKNGSILNLTGSEGVSINPPDISPLRRSGSSVVCVYVGEGDWQVFGEIP